MSASRTKSFRFSHALADAIELRAKQLGYASGTDLIKGIARYDVLCQSSHGVTKEWAKLSPEEQDLLDGKLLVRAIRQKGMRAADAARVDWRDL
ncbi:hypothetical protein SAMN02745166_04813 [Prosthecobacter debontii]|uniref:Uncharacterized protein n=1 Tax=Prosthecobacter debontii TaxID=48467 RepID=A0A1T4Z306_9BACT|nr:hypothetical protein [Prosthecobacter debontii]SKB07915.1 hypothetical protein SAMN02745166_04813 [Prosthecobacter debontii]